nr:hypothetical protein Iba_chr10dCG10940 [Ipomoea batatas]
MEKSSYSFPEEHQAHAFPPPRKTPPFQSPLRFGVLMMSPASDGSKSDRASGLGKKLRSLERQWRDFDIYEKDLLASPSSIESELGTF